MLSVNCLFFPQDAQVSSQNVNALISLKRRIEELETETRKETKCIKTMQLTMAKEEGNLGETDGNEPM